MLLLTTMVTVLNISCRKNSFSPEINTMLMVPAPIPPIFTSSPDTSKGSPSEVMIDTGFVMDMSRGERGNLYLRGSFLRRTDYARNNKVISSDSIVFPNTLARQKRTIKSFRNASSQCLKPAGVKFFHDQDELGSLHCEYSRIEKSIMGNSTEQSAESDYALGVRIFITIDPDERQFRNRSRHFDYYRWLQVVYTNAGTLPNGQEIAEKDLGKKRSYLDPHNDCYHIFSRSDLRSIGPGKALEDQAIADDLKLYFKCNDDGHIVIREADREILQDYCIVPFYGLGQSTGEIDPDADFEDQPKRFLSHVDQMGKRLFWDGVVALYGVKRASNSLSITRLRMLNYGFDLEHSRNSANERLQESIVMAMINYKNHKKEWDRFNAGLQKFLKFFEDPKYRGYLCEPIDPLN